MAKTYTVKGGDTLSKIYKSLGYSSWNDLWNSWKSSSRSGGGGGLYGGGGGGGAFSGSANRAGGTGGAGIIIVHEYY